MADISDREAFPEEVNLEAVKPDEVIPPLGSDLAAPDYVFPAMDQALVAEIKGLVPDSKTQTQILGRIGLLDDGPEALRLLVVGASHSETITETATGQPVSQGYVYMKGATDLWRILEAQHNRRHLRGVAGLLDKIGAKVYHGADDTGEEAEAV